MAPGESLDSIQSGDTWVGGYLGGRISHTLAHCPVLPPGWLPPTVSMSTGKEAPDPKTLPGVTVPSTAGPELRPPDPEPLALLPRWPPPAPRDVSHRNRSVRTALQVSKSSQAPGKCPLAYVLCPHPCPHPDPLLPPQTPGLPPSPRRSTSPKPPHSSVRLEQRARVLSIYFHPRLGARLLFWRRRARGRLVGVATPGCLLGAPLVITSSPGSH